MELKKFILILFLAFSLNACSQGNFFMWHFPQITPDSGCSIGDAYQGGIVVYLFKSGDPGYVIGECHGFIASPDLSITAYFGCSGTYMPTDYGTLPIGVGQNNTNIILSACSTTGIAARLCDDYSNEGYSDWYLPSNYEIQYAMGANGGGYPLAFVDGEYYASSSTTGDTGNFYSVRRLDLVWNSYFYGRSLSYYVKAFRTF